MKKDAWLVAFIVAVFVLVLAALAIEFDARQDHAVLECIKSGRAPVECKRALED